MLFLFIHFLLVKSNSIKVQLKKHFLFLSMVYDKSSDIVASQLHTNSSYFQISYQYQVDNTHLSDTDKVTHIKYSKHQLKYVHGQVSVIFYNFIKIKSVFSLASIRFVSMFSRSTLCECSSFGIQESTVHHHCCF